MKEYWNNRIRDNKCYTSVGDIGLSNVINKYIKESLFKIINNSLKGLNFSLRGKRILDVGCGTGIYSDFYSQKGAEVFGFDFSEEAIKKTQERGIPGYYSVASLSEIPFNSSSFDLTHCFSVLYHIVSDSEWQRALKELCRVTRRGGFLLLLTEWVSEAKQFSFYQKYRKRTDYLKILDPLFEQVKIISVKDVPKYPHIAKWIPWICIAFGLFKEDRPERVLIFKKK